MLSDRIDGHAHLMAEPDYTARHIETAARFGIARTVASGLGATWGMLDNDGVLAEAERHGDALIPLAFILLGRDTADAVSDAKRRGFAGLKITQPLFPYDDERAFPVYERAEDLGLPILFHSGVMAHAPGVFTSADYMRPLRLDGVARRFPGLRMQIAHLGVPEYECAATLARIVPNLYVDMTGSLAGWRANKTPEFIASLLYWPTWHRKVIFGTDERYEFMEKSLKRQTELLACLPMEDAAAASFYRDNAREFYGEIEREPYESVCIVLDPDAAEKTGRKESK